MRKSAFSVFAMVAGQVWVTVLWAGLLLIIYRSRPDIDASDAAASSGRYRRLLSAFVRALLTLVALVNVTLGGFLQDVSGGSFLSTAVVLAVALVLGGLVMLTLRRQADKPVLVAQPEAAAASPRPRTAASQRAGAPRRR